MSYVPIFAEPTLTDRDFHHHSTHETFPSKNSNQFSKKNPSRRVAARNGKSKKSSSRNGSSSYPIIVHCHLCWDWVWQRPQQFISRLSKQHRVLFVETVAPDAELAAPVARFRSPAEFPNLTILRLQFPAWRWNDGAYVDGERRRLVQEFL